MTELVDEKEALKEGKERVRRLLIARLDEAGLARAKGSTVEAHAAFLARLVDHLAYMSAENLGTLSELVMDAAQGPGRNLWPSEVAVRALAHGLQEVPFRQHPIVRSWLASVEGPRADVAGHLVELFRFLAQFPRPPSAMQKRAILDEAASNARAIERIRNAIEADRARPEDRVWLERYMADRELARGIVAEGQARREAAARAAVAASAEAENEGTA